MRCVNTVIRLALLPLVGLVTLAAAQDEPNREREGSRPEQPPPAAVAIGEKELTIPLEIAAPKSASCGATIALQYSQRNTVARVEGTIDNKDCAASKGEYAVVIRIRDENGELKTLEFAESWHRDDDQPVKFQTDYPIGENVDLVSARAGRLRCGCAEPPAQ